MAFQISFDKTDVGVRVVMDGTIDEDVNFATYSLQGINKVDIILKGVKGINSCGIREWIKWMQTASPFTEIRFQECPKVIVDQMNMVDGFLPKAAKVESFFVPYYSEDSGEEKVLLFKYGKEFDETKLQMPEAVKDKAGHTMEIDVIESKYFKFLKKAANG